MFSLFNCCQSAVDKDFEFDLDISHTTSSPSTLDDEIKKIKLTLRNKLCLFTIHSKTRDLFPFNELKFDEDVENILSKKYFEIYKRPNNILSQAFIEKYSFKKESLITMILSLENNVNKELNLITDLKIIDCLKDKDVTRHNIKNIIKIYQYILYKPPPEPDIKDPNCCNITFRFIDDKLSFSRRYNKNIKIEELYFLLKSKYPEMTFKLYKISPSIELNELQNNLEQENLYPSGLIQVIC